mmetsp:Transcript_1699/g.3936  ORF Transcript_1699/g.3936 Transcript_1699/m.3936 type:complete len:274 (-) Transcript_1699:753-1574(-)
MICVDQRLALDKLHESTGERTFGLQVLVKLLDDLPRLLEQVEDCIHFHGLNARQILGQLSSGGLHKLQAELLVDQEYSLVDLCQAFSEADEQRVLLIILNIRIMVLKPGWVCGPLDDELQSLHQDGSHLLQRHRVTGSRFHLLTLRTLHKALHLDKELSEEWLKANRDLMLLMRKEPEDEWHQGIDGVPGNLCRAGALRILDAEIHIGLQHRLRNGVEHLRLLEKLLARAPLLHASFETGTHTQLAEHHHLLARRHLLANDGRQALARLAGTG